MALTILNEQYPPRKPKLTLTADSLDELPTEGVAEGSTATVDGTEYVYENNSGWIEPGSGGGGGGGGGGLLVHVAHEEGGAEFTCNKTWKEIKDVVDVGGAVYFDIENSYGGSVYMVSLSYISESSGYFYAYATQSDYVFSTDSEDGYPSAYWE